MNERRRIKIVKTEGEWEAIDAYLSNTVNVNWRKFWEKKMASLKQTYQTCPSCVTVSSGNKTQRWINITEAQYQFLLKVSEEHNLSMSQIADAFALIPILLEKK